MTYLYFVNAIKSISGGIASDAACYVRGTDCEITKDIQVKANSALASLSQKFVSVRGNERLEKLLEFDHYVQKQFRRRTNGNSRMKSYTRLFVSAFHK